VLWISCHQTTSAGMVCRPWVLELIQYLLTGGAFIAGRC